MFINQMPKAERKIMEAKLRKAVAILNLTEDDLQAAMDSKVGDVQDLLEEAEMEYRPGSC